MRHLPRFWVLASLSLTAALLPSTGTTAPLDPAARGLDAFLHVAGQAPAGSMLSVDLETFGFAQVTDLSPLPGATVDLVWDPEHLGKGVTVAPPAVSVTTDATGHATARVPVPDGEDEDLVLLARIRHGAHARTREMKIKRTSPYELTLHVADPNVVPGGEISAWAMLSSQATGEPVPATPVRITLVEANYPRTVVHAVTDAAGTAMVRIPIPPLDDPSLGWTLSAELDRAAPGPHSDIALAIRDETPGSPFLAARFDEPSVDTGSKATFTLHLTDGSLEPIASADVRYWTGPRGTSAPATDEAWLAGSRLGKTDPNGDVHGEVASPAVVRGEMSSIDLEARANVLGEDLTGKASIMVGAPSESLTLSPEAKVIVPGLEQRMLLRVRDEKSLGVEGEFEVKGDGLAETVKTDASGEAEITWRVPSEVGAARNVGPCASGVAATVVVRPKGKIPALEKHTDPFEVCVAVDREATSIVHFDRTTAHVGDKVHVSVASTAKGKDPFSVVLRTEEGAVAASAWVDGASGGDVELGPGKSGPWSVTATAPSGRGKAVVASSSLLVLPRLLPRLDAKITSSRVAPGGSVDIDAQLSDDNGKPMTGTVASVIVDLAGGGSVEGIRALDTRTSLCRALAITTDRCDAALQTSGAMEAARRGALSELILRPLAPSRDPGGEARSELDSAFASVLRSLEGAVYESSTTPDTLRDVRRHTAHGWELNPELLTLTTAAMNEPPRTPGGEPITLTDLLAIDKQVTFDNVARRVTRLKLMQLLAAVRRMKHDRNLDDSEPIFNDPNAMLRRMVSDGRIGGSALLDPWGGTFAFVRGGAAPAPFLGVVRGYELRSAGPDGAMGTGDDIRDPFTRVLASGTPYARALEEDRIVDAKYDMEVSEATVDSWQTLLTELTGMTLGGTGTGQGFGSGHGRLGGSHTSRSPSLRMGSTSSQREPALWTPPVRTDDQGHVHLTIPLDFLETTWGIGLVAIPDHAPPATRIVELPVALPLSARVDSGARWEQGDAVTLRVTLRNRTQNVAHATVAATASGAVDLADGREAKRTIDVQPGAVTSLPLDVKGPRAGEAKLVVHVSAAGFPDDELTQSWEVRVPGVRQTRVRSMWVSSEANIEVPLEAGESWDGPARVTLERGFADALSDALSALEPDALRSSEALAASLEVASRVGRWAKAQPDRANLAARADLIAARASARLLGAMAREPNVSLATLEARNLYSVMPALQAGNAPHPLLTGEAARQEGCPKDLATTTPGVLEAEPPVVGGAALPCWDTFVSDATKEAGASDDPVKMARGVLALADRPHRMTLMTGLAGRLRDKVALAADGSVRLAGARRSDRVLVYAALMRASQLGTPMAATEETLAGWLTVDRDARGGYGSAPATKAVVRALLGSKLGVAQPSRVTLTLGDTRMDVAVPASGRVTIPVKDATKVIVQTHGAPLLARLERPLVRSFSHPPDSLRSALHLELTWPDAFTVGRSQTLHVVARGATNNPVRAVVRIPLPAGASLAQASSKVKQIQGTLVIADSFDGSDYTEDIPIRFAFAGHVLAPEATIASDSGDDEPGIAPAHGIVMR